MPGGEDPIPFGEPDAPVAVPEAPGTEVELQAARMRATTEVTHPRPEPVRQFGASAAPVVPSAADRVERFTAARPQLRVSIQSTINARVRAP
jgi:hypothetical protein